MKLLDRVDDLVKKVNALTLRQNQSECNHEFEEFSIVKRCRHTSAKGDTFRISVASDCELCNKTKRIILTDEKALEAFNTLTFIS